MKTVYKYIIYIHPGENIDRISIQQWTPTPVHFKIKMMIVSWRSECPSLWGNTNADQIPENQSESVVNQWSRRLSCRLLVWKYCDTGRHDKVLSALLTALSALLTANNSAICPANNSAARIPCAATRASCSFIARPLAVYITVCGGISLPKHPPPGQLCALNTCHNRSRWNYI